MTPASPVDDPNFPPNLAIVPSTSRRRNEHNNDESVTPSDSDDDSADAKQDIETYGIAGRTWEAAYLLRTYLTSGIDSSSPNSPLFDPPCPLHASLSHENSTKVPRRRKILEIGSGTGYLGLSLAPHLLQTDTLILSDLENVCPLLTSNLSRAQSRWRSTRQRTLEPTCLVRPLPWGDCDSLSSSILQPGLHPNFILCSDLVYFPFLYPPLLKTLLGLTEWKASDDPRREPPTILFSYKIRSLVREQPFWEAFGRWFEFEAVQIGRTVVKADEDRESSELAKGQEPRDGTRNEVEREWSRFGAARRSGLGSLSEAGDDSDELYVFVAHRRPSTLGITDILLQGDRTDEDLMLGKNGLAGAIDGGARFEEMLLASLEWD